MREFSLYLAALRATKARARAPLIYEFRDLGRERVAANGK